MRFLLLSLMTAVPFVAAAQDATAPARAERKGPPPAPKNLKILKPEEIGPAMRLFRASLGVQCTGCHVQGDFASDAKPEKEIARKMILMTRQINANFPDIGEHEHAATEHEHPASERVTCFTCHNGAEHPKTAPAAVKPAPPPAAPAE